MSRLRPSARAFLMTTIGIASACSVALQPADAPRPSALPDTAPTPTAMATETAPPPVEPTPPPTIAYLEKLPYVDELPAPDPAATSILPATPLPEPTLATAAPAGAIAPEAAPAPLALTTGTVALSRRGDLVLAPGRIGGRPIGDVLLDTSAGSTFIDRTVAEQIGLAATPMASTDGTGVDPDATMRELPGLALGDIALAADRAFVLDLAAADATGGALAGIVGFPAFGSAPFTIDFGSGTLTVHPDASFEPPAAVQAEALRIDQGLPFVEATLADGSTVWLLLDTGSPFGLSVWRGFAKQHPGLLKPAASPPDDPTAVRGSELRVVSVLGDQYTHLPVDIDVGPLRPWQRARVVGRVGMGMLRELRITIHPVTERIWVERP